MRILSKHRDYYDYISDQLGADPNCVYLRGKLKHEVAVDRTLEPIAGRIDVQRTNNLIDLAVLVAGTRTFPMVGRVTGYLRWHWVPYEKESHEGLFRFNRSKREYVQPPSYTLDEVKMMVRAVGAPVFLVLGVDPNWRKGTGSVVRVAENPPVLADLGIPSLVPATQMWQEIYTTLTSVLRRDPDKEPPCSVNNEERIVAAGFDLKTSFRFPTNPKKL